MWRCPGAMSRYYGATKRRTGTTSDVPVRRGAYPGNGTTYRSDEAMSRGNETMYRFDEAMPRCNGTTYRSDETMPRAIGRRTSTTRPCPGVMERRTGTLGRRSVEGSLIPELRSAAPDRARPCGGNPPPARGLRGSLPRLPR